MALLYSSSSAVQARLPFYGPLKFPISPFLWPLNKIHWYGLGLEIGMTAPSIKPK